MLFVATGLSKHRLHQTNVETADHENVKRDQRLLTVYLSYSVCWDYLSFFVADNLNHAAVDWTQATQILPFSLIWCDPAV